MVSPLLSALCCHQISQIRDVHIYCLVRKRTVDILEKRLLGDIAIEGGDFTTAFLKECTISDLFDSSAGGGEQEQEGVREDTAKEEAKEEAKDA